MLLKQGQEVIALELGTLSQQLILFKAEFPSEASGNSAQTLLWWQTEDLQTQEEKSIGCTKNRLWGPELCSNPVSIA